MDNLNENLTDNEKIEIDGNDCKRRPDLFLYRQYPLYDGSTLRSDNIIIELKRPNVEIGIEQYRQIQDYMRLIKKTPGFNGDNRLWKFYIIGKDMSDEVRDIVRQKQKEGKEAFLADEVNNCKIFAVKWDDLFESFKIKNDFLLGNLKIDKETLIKEFKDAEIPSESMPDFLVSKISSERE